MENTTYKASDAITFGWQATKENFWLLIGISVLYMIVSSLFGGQAKEMTDLFSGAPHMGNQGSVLGSLISNVISLIFIVGMFHAGTKLFHKEQITFKDFFVFTGWGIYLRLVGVILLCMLLFIPIIFLFGALSFAGIFVAGGAISFSPGPLVIIGGILLILGIGYLSLRLAFVYYLAIEDVKPLAVFKQSWLLTKGRVLPLLWLMVLGCGVMLLGVLALFVGIFVAVPVITLAGVYTYHIFKGTKQTVAVTTPEEVVTAPVVETPVSA